MVLENYLFVRFVLCGQIISVRVRVRVARGRCRCDGKGGRSDGCEDVDAKEGCRVCGIYRRIIIFVFEILRK